MNVNHPGLGAYDTVERQNIVKSPENARSGRISGQILAALVGSATLAIIGLCAVLAVTV